MTIVVLFSASLPLHPALTAPPVHPGALPERPGKERRGGEVVARSHIILFTGRRAAMHGFVHVEIPARDVRRAKNFYGKVFGWTFQLRFS
jgi:hypothetical protein